MMNTYIDLFGYTSSLSSSFENYYTANLKNKDIFYCKYNNEFKILLNAKYAYFYKLKNESNNKFAR